MLLGGPEKSLIISDDTPPWFGADALIGWQHGGQHLFPGRAYEVPRVLRC
jgi:hypothetical protein